MKFFILFLGEDFQAIHLIYLQPWMYIYNYRSGQ